MGTAVIVPLTSKGKIAIKVSDGTELMMTLKAASKDTFILYTHFSASNPLFKTENIPFVQLMPLIRFDKIMYETEYDGKQKYIFSL